MMAGFLDISLSIFVVIRSALGISTSQNPQNKETGMRKNIFRQKI